MSSKKSPDHTGVLNPLQRGRREQFVDSETLGGQIKAARKDKGFKTQGEFARALGVKRVQVVRYETNQQIPSAIVLRRINKLLDTTFRKEEVGQFIANSIPRVNAQISALIIRNLPPEKQEVAIGILLDRFRSYLPKKVLDRVQDIQARQPTEATDTLQDFDEHILKENESVEK